MRNARRPSLIPTFLQGLPVALRQRGIAAGERSPFQYDLHQRLLRLRFRSPDRGAGTPHHVAAHAGETARSAGFGFENASHSGTDHRHGDRATSWTGGVSSEQQQQEFNNWAAAGSPQQGATLRYPIPDYLLRTGHFYSSVHHKGENYAALYWTRIKNYNVKILVASNDQDFLRKSKHAMAGAAHFYCTQDDGTLTTTDGKPVKPEGDLYMGPTVPTSLADSAVKDKPALENIPLGGVSDGIYRNPDLGLQYEIPKGWDVSPAEANDDPPRDATALREHEFLHACSKTLLRIVQHGSSDAAHKAAKPTIILRALDPILSLDANSVFPHRQECGRQRLCQLGSPVRIWRDHLRRTGFHLRPSVHGVSRDSCVACDPPMNWPSVCRKSFMRRFTTRPCSFGRSWRRPPPI